MSERRKRLRQLLPGACIMIAVIALDRLSKRWAEGNLPGQGLTGGIPGLIGFRYAENTGAAFSSFAGQNALLSIFTAVLIAVLLILLLRGRIRESSVRIGLFLMAGGGIGNLIDRVARGSVIDFIEFRFLSFATFNVADAAICLGGALAVIGAAIAERRKKPSEDEHA